jgi:uncharacterized protein YndB with AHSA1/START domain
MAQFYNVFSEKEELKMDNMITVEAIINKNIDNVWRCFITPEHVVNWNWASEGWHSPSAVNEFRVNGSFSYRMEAKDGSEGFDFTGIYDEIIDLKEIRYTLGDGRRVQVLFKEENQKTTVTESFEPESVFPPEYQKEGWQSIMNHFKSYVESL